MNKPTLPAPQSEKRPMQYSEIQDKKKELQEALDARKKSLDKKLNFVNKNARSILLIAGSAYLSYRFSRWLFSSPKSSPQKIKKAPEQAYTHNTPKEKEVPKPEGFWKLVKRNITLMLIDLGKQKLQEEIEKKILSRDKNHDK